MIIIAVINVAAFIGIGVTSQWYPEFMIASLLYSTAGILAVVGSKKQSSHGVAIGCLVIACVTLCTAFAQVGQ
jgi:hypothetical protein